MFFPSIPRDLRLLAVLALLYMTQGIPLGLAMEALPTMLRQDGAPLHALALLPAVGLPWIVKVIWAPLVDNHWSPRLGRRRSWILPMQSVVLACLLAVAALGLQGGTAPIAIALFFMASLASATQDTATDGLAAESLSGAMLARANGIQIGGTMVGFFLGGSGCLILTGLLGRRLALLAVACIVAGGLLAIALWREEARAPTQRIPASLRRFLTRKGAGLVLAIALVTAMAASAPFALFKLLLIDRSWSVAQIGTLGMAGGVATILIGCGGGTWLITRMGVRPVLLMGLGAQMLSAGLWGLVAIGAIPLLLAAALGAVMLGSAGSGAASVCAMSLAMHFARQDRQAATDMTAVQSSRDLGEMGASALATAVAGLAGYGWAFVLPAVLAMGLLVVVALKPPNKIEVV